MFSTPTEKTCSTCGVTKPIDAFARKSSSRDGHATTCRSCAQQRLRDYRERLRERNAERDVWGQLKRCPSCDEVKQGHEFYRNDSSPDGLHWTCRTCNGRNRTRGGESRGGYVRYGETKDELLQRFEAQERRCAICRAPFGDEAPHVDHDHETGEVRGLLCRTCNVALGAFGDDPATVRAAAAYLRRTMVL